jgi:hypothetical protein
MEAREKVVAVDLGKGKIEDESEGEGEKAGKGEVCVEPTTNTRGGEEHMGSFLGER